MRWLQNNEEAICIRANTKNCKMFFGKTQWQIVTHTVLNLSHRIFPKIRSESKHKLATQIYCNCIPGA